MDLHIPLGAGRPVLVPLLSGIAFGTAAFTAHEAWSVLVPDGLHPGVVKAAAVIGAAGAGTILLSVEVGFAALTASGGLALGASCAAPGPMMTLGAMGAGLATGAAIQAAVSWGVSGLLVILATLLIFGVLTLSSQSHRGTLGECQYMDASDVMVMLAVGFTGSFVSMVFGLTERAFIAEWKGKALLWLIGPRVMLTILYIFLILLRIVTSKILWSVLGYLPYYSAVNFLSWVFPMHNVLAGFLTGVGATIQPDPKSEAELDALLESVLWVAVLSAGLIGAALGTVAVVGLGPEATGRIALGTAVTSFVAMRLILPACPVIGVCATVGGLVGGAVVAGVTLVMASSSTSYTVAFVWCSLGALVGCGGFVSMGKMSTFSVLIIAGGATMLPSWEAAVRLPFDHLILSAFLKTSVEGAMLGALWLGLTTLGSVLLGGAALWTAALGKVGTLGVLGATLVSLAVTVHERLKVLEEPKTSMEILGGIVITFAILSGIDLTYFMM